MKTSPARRGAGRQRGFTLVEMMVAVTIGLVVAIGLAVSFVNLKTTWGTQDKLAQLQDNERLAMAFLTSSVQEAGYYPDPTGASVITATTSVPYGNMAAQQFIGGQPVSGSAPSATLSTAYVSANNDGLLTCQGATNTSGSTASIRNVFFVDSSSHTLNCMVYANNSATAAPGAAAAQLVTNVDSMDVLYAVDSDGDGSVDKYLAAGAVGLTTLAQWQSVKAVRITLKFINPNSAFDGKSTIPWVQTINLMNNQ